MANKENIECLHVLLISRSDKIQNGFELAFSGLGLDVVRYDSGRVDLEVDFAENLYPFVVVDYEIDADFENLKSVLKIGNCPPILWLLPWQIDSSVLSTAYALGCADHLLKPIDSTVLRSKAVRLRNSQDCKKRLILELGRSNDVFDEFDYITSHDFQEPLRRISNYLQLLENRNHETLDANSKEFIRHAVEGSVRIKKLILDFSAYVKLGIGSRALSCLDVRAVVDDALGNLMAQGTEAGAQVEIGPLPKIVGDRDLLTQLFQNLIENSIEFRGGKTPRIEIFSEQVDSEWVFSIRDNGMGIESGHFKKIFLIFQQLHRRETHLGTGIGLAMCKKIVERHEGRIWVQSKIGAGTTFCFTLSSSPTEEFTNNSLAS